MAGFTHHDCLLVVLSSLENSTTLTTLDCRGLRDIQGRNVL